MRATKLTAVAAAFIFSASLAACGGDDAAEDTAAAPAATTTSAAPSMPAADAMAGFGAGCAAVPTDSANPGSFDAMSKVPVATAAAGNPLLSTLVTAVKEAGLVDTLNNTQDLTVFAPANDAFNAVPKATMDAAMKDPKGLLTKVLTGHVVAGKLAPGALAGEHKTLGGSTITVEGSGEDFTVDGNAKVVCGNVQTANATVYIIDNVLLPKS